MNQGIISSRYANALLKFATENKEEAQVYAEMQALSSAYFSVPAFKNILNNPVITATQKKEIFSAAATIDGKVSTSTLRFLDLLLEKQREDLMLFIAQSYISAYRQTKNIVESSLTIASTISEKTIEALKNAIRKKTDKNLEFSVHYDASLIGGFVLRYETYKMDASVKTKLANIERNLR